MNDTLREWEPRILSVLRIVVALLYLQHGLTKFFGFPGTAPSAMPLFPAILGGLIETIGSILLLVGLWSRPAAFIMSGEMAIAYWYAHFPRNPFPYNNGGSLAILYLLRVSLHLLRRSGPLEHRLDVGASQENRRRLRVSCETPAEAGRCGQAWVQILGIRRRTPEPRIVAGYEARQPRVRRLDRGDPRQPASASPHHAVGNGGPNETQRTPQYTCLYPLGSANWRDMIFSGASAPRNDAGPVE